MIHSPSIAKATGKEQLHRNNLKQLQVVTVEPNDLK